jgi:hypothetical protein
VLHEHASVSNISFLSSVVYIVASVTHMEYLVSENISDSVEELDSDAIFVMEIVNLNVYMIPLTEIWNCI